MGSRYNSIDVFYQIETLNMHILIGHTSQSIEQFAKIDHAHEIAASVWNIILESSDT